MSDVDKFGRLIQINRMSSTSGKHRTMLTCTIRKKVSLGFGIQKGTTMSYFTHPIAMSAPFTRSVAIAALMAATMLTQPADRSSCRLRR